MTTVTVRVPDAPEDIVSNTSEAMSKEGAFRILLVDDEEEIRLMQESLLKRLGHQTIGCANGEEALEILRDSSEAFDLVITDQTMPGISGMQLSNKCRNLYPGLPIILSTGYSTEELPERLEDVGIRAILPKPYTRKVLADLLQKVMGTG